jgi:hypothetical protein
VYYNEYFVTIQTNISLTKNGGNPRFSKDFRHFFSLSVNEASGIRTPDNLIKSQVLYRLS